MKKIPEDQHPMLDMDIALPLKVRDLIKLNQILSRTYDEEEGVRETLSPLLQEIRMMINEVETHSEWTSLRKWDVGQEVMEKSVSKQKKHLELIKKALVKNRNLRISYYVPGTGEMTRRTVIPMDLWQTDDSWLLRAYCYLDGEERTFRLDRVVKMKEKTPSKKKTRPIPEVRDSPLQFSDAEAEVQEEVVPDSEIEYPTDVFEYPAAKSEPEYSEDTEEESPETPDSESAENSMTKSAQDSPEKARKESGTHHYSLPGKKPLQPGLPNRLERLIKRVERKTPQ